jgi:gamma-glutamyl:cysteine ligase YbdK (ATP-grasp superfamily)
MKQSCTEKKNFDFNKRLTAETSMLEEWFENSYFTEEGRRIGAEIELFLLDSDLNPSPKNLQFISKINKEFLVPEVGAFHLEINTPSYGLTKDCFSLLHQNILQSLEHCKDYANKNNYFLAMIGSLPTATNEHHQISYLTKKKRYSRLNALIKKHNEGPIDINLEGFESIELQAESLAINGLLSAFQMHLQVGLSQSVRYYNIAQLLAGPILALSTNSPFFLNHILWHESRVFIFDETMTLNTFQDQKDFHCCVFGDDYLQSSFFELFKENIHFPFLIPEVIDFPTEKMNHVKQQNGVIYRWNRPVIDFDKAGVPHLRIEHRGPSSGPTVVDMVANAAFYYGLMQYYFESSEPIATILPFSKAKINFFNAAKYGLSASFYWGETHQQVQATVVLENLISFAKKGLLSLNIDKEDIEFYLNIIKKRLVTKTSGSRWQLQFVKQHGKDYTALLKAYLECQYNDIPVSEWRV